MPNTPFDLDAWAHRVGYAGPREPTLPVLRAVIAAQSGTIPFENVDVLLGRTPKLDMDSLQRKLVAGGRGGYCFELNALLRAALGAMGFQVTGLIARVIVGMEPDAPGPSTHMTLRVDLPEGPFLADCGFGNRTPTAPLPLRPDHPVDTPHETMRLMPEGEELVLQVLLGEQWQNIYRVSPNPPLPVDYEVANWFTATHPGSPFIANMIVARPGAEGVRNTFFNGRVTVRQPVPDAEPRTERRMLEDIAAFDSALRETFGLALSAEDLAAAITALESKGTRGAAHPFFT